MNQELLISINVSKNQTLLFYEDHLVYKGEVIKYADIEGISYLMTRTTTTVYFVPAGSTSNYNIKIKAKGKIHKIEFSAGTFFAGKGKTEKEKEELFAKFYIVIENVIKPYVVINLLLKFIDEKELNIDALKITEQGLYKKRTWRDPELLQWNQYYNAILEQGAVYIYKCDVKKKYKEFFTCSMDVMNAVVLPDLLNFLFQLEGKIDEKTKQELISRKESYSSTTPEFPKKEMNEKSGFCWSCGAPVEVDSKFCTHCGSKLS